MFVGKGASEAPEGSVVRGGRRGGGRKGMNSASEEPEGWRVAPCHAREGLDEMQEAAAGTLLVVEEGVGR